MNRGQKFLFVIVVTLLVATKIGFNFLPIEENALYRNSSIGGGRITSRCIRKKS